MPQFFSKKELMDSKVSLTDGIGDLFGTIIGVRGLRSHYQVLIKWEDGEDDSWMALRYMTVLEKPKKKLPLKINIVSKNIKEPLKRLKDRGSCLDFVYEMEKKFGVKV